MVHLLWQTRLSLQTVSTFPKVDSISEVIREVCPWDRDILVNPQWRGVLVLWMGAPRIPLRNQGLNSHPEYLIHRYLGPRGPNSRWEWLFTSAACLLLVVNSQKEGHHFFHDK